MKVPRRQFLHIWRLYRGAKLPPDMMDELFQGLMSEGIGSSYS
jgi:hypothetical protein